MKMTKMQLERLNARLIETIGEIVSEAKTAFHAKIPKVSAGLTHEEICDILIANATDYMKYITKFERYKWDNCDFINAFPPITAAAAARSDAYQAYKDQYDAAILPLEQKLAKEKQRIIDDAIFSDDFNLEAALNQLRQA